MLKTVKAPLLFVICSHFAFLSHAQSPIKLPTASPLPGEIKTLIADYPNRFAHILGEEIAKNPQSTEYNCSVKISGAEKSTITIYSSNNESSCGWEGLMLTTEDFNEAKKKYKTYCNQLSNLLINSPAGNFHLKGKYDEPSESKKFAGTILTPDKTVNGFTKLRLEISLQYEMLEWKLRLLVYDHQRSDSERGKTIE